MERDEEAGRFSGVPFHAPIALSFPYEGIDMNRDKTTHTILAFLGKQADVAGSGEWAKDLRSSGIDLSDRTAPDCPKLIEEKGCAVSGSHFDIERLIERFDRRRRYERNNYWSVFSEMQQSTL
jgi:hypothetical protein